MEYHLVVDEIEEDVVRLEDTVNATTLHLPRVMLPSEISESDSVTIVITCSKNEELRGRAQDLMREIIPEQRD